MQTLDPERSTGRTGAASSLTSAAASAWRRLTEAWRHGVQIQERLLELSRPWEAEGPMHWQRRSDGWRLMGEHLPPSPG